MKRVALLFLVAFSMLSPHRALTAPSDGVNDWRRRKETFSQPEKNFQEVIKRLRANHLDRALSDEEIYRAAAAGVLNALNSGRQDEPWNALISPREAEDLRIELSGRLTGIGASLDFNEDSGHARILATLPGSSAQKAGLRKDDRILSVEGRSYKGQHLGDIVRALRGPAGSTVKMKILREDRVIDFALLRAPLEMKAFEAARLNDSTGWIAIRQFTSDTSARVEKQLKEFEDGKITRLVLDLRGNTGGSFEEAVKAAGMLLPKGAVIVRTQDRNGQKTEHKATGLNWKPTADVVVLVDGQTSSGAELVAGALRDVRKAPLVGSETFGKWNVQSLEELPNGFFMKYSVLRFESPAGFEGHEGGLKPDLEIESPKPGSAALFESDPKKRLAGDAPLRAALELRKL